MNCNATKLPIMSDAVEVLRYVKVTNGVLYKDNFCQFTNLTCHKEEILTKCIDKQNCFIKNYWFNIPECRANSYYTELEYDCQPSKSNRLSFKVKNFMFLFLKGFICVKRQLLAIYLVD